MATPKYLRNKHTGAIQKYHPAKAQLPSMEPLAELPEIEPKEYKRRTVRPFDERQMEKKALREMAGEDAPEPVVEGKNNQTATEFAFDAEELEEISSNLKSALKKDDIMELAFEHFGMELNKKLTRKDMKERVNEMIQLAYAELEAQD